MAPHAPLRALSFPLLALLLLACGEGGRDGFDPLDAPHLPATVEGRVRTLDGAPVAGAAVYVVDGEGAHLIAHTDGEGAFVSDTSPSGPARLVVHDGAGNGLLKDVVLFTAGRNTLGELVVDTLEHAPQVLDIHGIGYEERLTHEPAGLEWPVFRRDGARAWAVRRPQVGEGWELVSIDTASGQVSLVTGLVTLDAGWQPLTLYADRVLHVRLSAEGDSLFLDAETGRTLVDATVAPEGVWEARGHVYLLARRFPQRVGSTFVYAVQPLRIDASTGAVTQGEYLADSRHLGSFELLEHDEERLVYVPWHGCGLYDESFLGCTEEEAAEPALRLVYTLDFSTLTSRRVTALTDVGRTFGNPGVLAGEPRALFLVRGRFWDSGTHLSRLDLATGERVDLLQALEGERLPRLWTDPSRSALALLSDTPLSASLFRLTLEGQATRLSTQVRTPLGTREACAPQAPGSDVFSTRCEVDMRADGSLRVRDGWTESDRTTRSVLLDLDAEGVPVRTQVFAVGREDGLIAPQLARDGTTEVALIREGPTGFLQAFTARTGEPLARRTFLRADHLAASVSADGRWLFSVALDPLSGRPQLFRVALP